MIWAFVGGFFAGMVVGAALLLLWCIIRSGGGAAEGSYSDDGVSLVGSPGEAGDRCETGRLGRSCGKGGRWS